MERAPDDEIPPRPVPKPAKEHGEEKIEVAPPAAEAVAAERDVEVVAEKTGEGDVPAPPEIDDVAGFVGRVEIERKRDVEHPPEADRHV